MTAIAQPVTGQDINVAARATRRVLDAILAEKGASFAPFATMNTIVAVGASLDRVGLVQHLSAALDVDTSTVQAILHGLETRGLTRQAADHLELTPAGHTERQRLSQPLAAVTAELYRDFDDKDLVTARQVLVTVTERANAYFGANVF